MIFECQKHDVPNKDCPGCFAASRPLTGEEQAQARFELRGLRKQLAELHVRMDREKLAEQIYLLRSYYRHLPAVARSAVSWEKLDNLTKDFWRQDYADTLLSYLRGEKP